MNETLVKLGVDTSRLEVRVNNLEHGGFVTGLILLGVGVGVGLLTKAFNNQKKEIKELEKRVNGLADIINSIVEEVDEEE